MIIRVVDNDDERFAGETLIECVDNGRVLWRSWLPDDVDPAIRLNPDHPVARDDRSTTTTTEIAYRVPTVEEAPSVGIEDPEQHKAIAAYAVAKDVVTLADAAAAAELSEDDLIIGPSATEATS